MRLSVAFLACATVGQVKHSFGASFDCHEGCDLDPAVNGESVCGEDGITYFNECFAVCQVKHICSCCFFRYDV
jgi:Kazal-type serine protease inhibitor domain